MVVVPKHAIVLCHGLFGFDYLGPPILKKWRVSYWKKIYDHLCKQGVKVLIAKVPPIAPIHIRAKYLREFLEVQSSIYGIDAKFNLIGHSMGGLDARYVNWMMQDASLIKSITCLATPNLGSIIANRSIDVFEGRRDLSLKVTSSTRLSPYVQLLKMILRSMVNLVDLNNDQLENRKQFPSFMTELPFEYLPNSSQSVLQRKDIFIKRSLYHLTPEFISIFNSNVNNETTLNNAYCSSYAGDIRSLLPENRYDLLYPWRVTYPELEEHDDPENDGLVSVTSASSPSFGPCKGKWKILHPNFSRDWSMPLSLKNNPNVDPNNGADNVLDLYDAILQDLILQGL